MYLFQNLECEILLKKTTILGLKQVREDFYIFKKLPVNFWYHFHVS
ncbi:hypothetical protein LEP1GSC074_3943 [Leptospira noguchii str. Hook]|uniref:Uncharacterized protein n=1 Tax=Leptospira noguchii serovar Autumnalis str. ZUN142 TaxID=1085540 RepID=M6UP00_9LEPT|nr:hypothetical protein LEP1GSC186_0140 [Leptospira noguchii serovar Autumnalis str. ZUN142]EMS85667.1 hypothetical protein LEP1GSC074_3943 [Leptospira noguchii str. Hook]